MGIQLFETSAKDNINVEEMFMAITKMVLRTKKEHQQRTQLSPDGNNIRLGAGGRASKKSTKQKCCS